MVKYGVKEVFDIFVYDKDGLLFKIDTVKDIFIRRNFEKRENELIIKDALLDVDVINDILSGKYDDKHLRINGVSMFRNAETHEDKRVALEITVAKLSKYFFPCSCNEASVVTLGFRFPDRVYDFKNAMLKVEE
jgi:hypothetical protein